MPSLPAEESSAPTATEKDNGDQSGKPEVAPSPPSVPVPATLRPTLCRDSMYNDDLPFSFSWKDFVARNFYISGAWDLEYYYTIRGSENFHIYLWIAKDWAWTQEWQYPAIIFGSMAVAWCFVMAYHAWESGVPEEMYMLIALVLWLCANFVWMTGELYYGDDDYVAPRAAIIMEVSASHGSVIDPPYNVFKINRAQLHGFYSSTLC